jgi:hypothetical protein
MSGENKQCKCNVNAFMVTSLSTGYRSYTCGKIWSNYLKNIGKTVSKVKKSIKIVSCDYNFEEQIPFFTFPIVHAVLPKKEFTFKYTPIPKQTQLRELKHKVRYFMSEKIFTTFQQIEFLCKGLDIPIYDHITEDLNDFCDRVLVHEV